MSDETDKGVKDDKPYGLDAKGDGTQEVVRILQKPPDL